MSAEAVVLNYKRRAEVERVFRALKGVDLQVRPIRRRLEARVAPWTLSTRQPSIYRSRFFHVRIAMAIMLYPGVRRSGAVAIGREHKSQDGQRVTFRMFKGRKKGVRMLTLPILAPLRAILDASELGHQARVETCPGKPYSNEESGNACKNWCKEAGLPQCHCHGLRKIGAVRAAEAGASEREPMAMFGWEDAGMARVYTRKAAQKKLAVSGPPNKAYARWLQGGYAEAPSVFTLR